MVILDLHKNIHLFDAIKQGAGNMCPLYGYTMKNSIKSEGPGTKSRVGLQVEVACTGIHESKQTVGSRSIRMTL